MGDLRANIALAIGLMLVWGSLVWLLPRPRFGVHALLWTALAVRAILVFSEPTLSDDVFRYLWEGKVAWEGGNPYVHAPSNPIWDAWGPDSIRSRVAHPDVPAIYPPLALWFFGLIGKLAYAPWSAKVVMGVVDALVAFTMARILHRRGRALGPAWLYALHPLGAVESAGSGHMEPLAILCVLQAIEAWDKQGEGGGWAVLGMWFKLLPAAILPRIWRGRPGLILAGLFVGALSAYPFMSSGENIMTGMTTYVQHWSFNGALFPLFEWAFAGWARPIAMLVGLFCVVRAIRVHVAPERIALWAGGAFVLLSPTLHPWYVLWVWVPALICGVRSWSILATLIPLSYAALASYDPLTSSWEEPWWPPLLSTVPFLLVLVWESVHHATQPGPWAPGPVQRKRRSVSRTEPDASTLFQR